MASVNPFESSMGPEPSLDRVLKLVADPAFEDGMLTDEEETLYREYKRSTGLVWEDPKDHYANLAHTLAQKDPRFLNKLGHDLVERIADDDRTRAAWMAMEQEGIKYLGVDPNVVPSADFNGASDAIHPILAEACVQFQSRAMRVLWPAGGPYKATPLGKITDEKQAQAQRVQGHMNYHVSKVLTDARRKQAQMLFRLPLSGSYFTKPYYDHVTGVVDRAMIPAENFIVPYKAESLESAPRYTEVCRLTKNEVKKRQVSGEFLKLELVSPNEDALSGDTVAQIIDEQKKETEGRQNVHAHDDDDRRTLYYTAVELDIPGFEDKDERGKKTGIELPYLVVTDRDSQKVLHVSRLWRESDPRKRKIIEYNHYLFIPGLGFYGYGFYHILGGMVRGSTGVLRALLDAGGFANLKGGFKTTDVSIKGDKKMIGHGEFHDVDFAGDGSLKDHFVLLQYGEPSAVLYQLLGDMVEWSRRLMGITESLVGEGTSAVPVGTQLSRIEQGTIVATEVHRNIHTTQAQEGERIAELMWIWGDDEYAYDVPGETRRIKRTDFDPTTIDIALATDPEFITNAQRYYLAEASMEIAARNPEVYDQVELHRRAQNALQIQNVDELVPRTGDMAARMGPVEENAGIMVGIPVKGFPEQDHQSHIIVHQQLLMGLGQGEKDLAASIQAHIREHMALQYLQQMQMQTGQQFELPTREELARGEYMPDDPQIENQVAQAAAQAAQEMLQQQMSQPTPEEMELERKMARDDEKAARDNARRDAMAEASIQRANVQAAAKGEVDMERALREEARSDAQAESNIQRKNVETAETLMIKQQQQREKNSGLPE